MGELIENMNKIGLARKMLINATEAGNLRLDLDLG